MSTKKDTKGGMIIITILCMIGLFLAIYSLTKGYSDARHYSLVCTETTVGEYVRTDYRKGNSAKVVVFFEYDGYRYKAEGNKKALKGVPGNAVPVHFNPTNPNQAYCGDKPYSNRGWNLAFLIVLSIVLILDARRLIAVFKND